jgi:hypothetical protein
MAKQDQKDVQESLKKALGGGITQDQLDVWKANHGKVYIVSVVVDENRTLTGYFKKPGRDIIANCVNLTHEGRLFEAREFLWNNSWLGGDAELKTNEDAAMAGQVKLWGCFSFLKAEAQTY